MTGKEESNAVGRRLQQRTGGGAGDAGFILHAEKAGFFLISDEQPMNDSFLSVNTVPHYHKRRSQIAHIWGNHGSAHPKCDG